MRGNIGVEIVMDPRRGSRQRGLDIDHRRQHVQLDHDVVERVLGNVAALRDDDRQRLADVANLVLASGTLRALVEDDAGDRRRRHQQWPVLPVAPRSAAV